MEMNLSSFILMTILNSLICILIPKLASFNWSGFLASKQENQQESDMGKPQKEAIS